MSISVGELVGTISLEDRFSGPIGEVAGKLGIAGDSFMAITGFAGLAAGGIAAATAAIVTLGTHGAEVEDVRSGFQSYSEAVGSTADVMLGTLREATDGTISDFELMKMGITALKSGFTGTSEEMGVLAAGSRLLADRMGGDTTEAFNTLSEAMLRGRTRGLAQLGVFVDTEGALRTYANSLGTTVEKLTETQRATAIQEATLAALRNELEANGRVQLDFADKMDQGKVAVQNFVDNLSSAIATSPVLAEALDGIRTGIVNAFGSSQQGQVEGISRLVNEFAIFLVQAAQVAVNVAQFMSDAWNGTKMIFNGFLQALSEGIASVAGFFVSMDQSTVDWLSDAIPGFGAMQGAMQGVKDTADSMARGFNEGMEASGLAAENNTIALAAVSTHLEEMEAKMTSAMDAAIIKGPEAAGGVATVRGAVEEVKVAIDGLSVAQSLWAEFAANSNFETEQTYRRLQDELIIAQTDGLTQRLVQLTIAHEQELTALDEQRMALGTRYDEMVALVNSKYQAMATSAVGAVSQMSGSFSSLGVLIRGDMEESGIAAVQMYDEMLGAALFAFTGINLAHRTSNEAQLETDRTVAQTRAQLWQSGLASASSILRSIFGQNKTAAIAAAIIDTAAAVVRSMREYPMPFALIPMAAAAAAGAAQIAAIRSQGFAMGSDGFENFGSGSLAMLHNEEEIIPRAKGESMAELFSSAIHGSDARTGAAVDRLGSKLDDLSRSLRRTIRDAVLQGTATS